MRVAAPIQINMLRLLLMCVGLLCITGTQSQQTVHVVFMNHLDVGYNGISPITGFINNVLNKYFMVYFPRAARLGKELEDKGFVERFVYTTHPWLVSMFMDCPEGFELAGVKLECPTEDDKTAFKQAVAAGYITWHAGPMNLQPEMADDVLFEFGIQLGKDLDTQFGIERPVRVLSQRDVPGMTQSVIPVLKRQGVSAVSVGVNPMTSPPAVPKLFVWQYGDDEVIGTWHPGGYPDNPGPDPANPGGLSRDDCVIIKGFDHVLCFAFRTDNSGPPNAYGEVLQYYEILRKEFPGANLKASTLDAFMAEVVKMGSKLNLPVITNEIGDTWIQGIASDPLKTSMYRMVSRVLKKCVQENRCKFEDKEIYEAYRILIKLPEHTWGLPSVNDNGNWTNAQFQKVKTEGNFVNCSKSWAEQRDVLRYVLRALGNHPVRDEISSALMQLKPSKPDLQALGYKEVEKSNWGAQWKCGSKFRYQFANDGSISYLTNGDTKWATTGYPLSKFMYRSYNQTDFDLFSADYNYNGASAGYYKRNVTKAAHPESLFWRVNMEGMYVKQDDSCNFYLQLKMADPLSVVYYGAPDQIWIKYDFSADGSGVDIELQIFDKTTTRLPEALFMTFIPAPQSNTKWSYQKMGLDIDPHNVILNGSQYQHVADSVTMKSTSGTFEIDAMDTPLACPITDNTTPTVFDAPLTPVKLPIRGMAYNIYNNVWDTNYILWYPYLEGDENFKARYRMTFS